MSDPQGTFKMKFVGRPNGRLLKGAPGNYKHGETYMQPYHMSKFAFWELLEDAPELVAPDPSEADSVYEAAPQIEENDVAPVEVSETRPVVDEPNVDPDADAIIEPYMSLRDGRLVAYEEKITTSDSSMDDVTVSTSNDPVELSREDLMDILAAHGVDVKSRTRTTTLRKMVEELDSKE